MAVTRCSTLVARFRPLVSQHCFVGQKSASVPCKTIKLDPRPERFRQNSATTLVHSHFLPAKVHLDPRIASNNCQRSLTVATLFRITSSRKSKLPYFVTDICSQSPRPFHLDSHLHIIPPKKLVTVTGTLSKKR